MTFAGTCVCGQQAESFGGLCDRCVALNTLELPPNASDSQIDESYRTLVKVWHPDRFQSDEKTRLAAEEKLQEINEAHQFLLATPDHPHASSDTSSRPKPPPLPEDRFRAPVAETALDPELQEQSAVRCAKKRQGDKLAPGVLLKAGLVLIAMFAFSMLWLVFDSMLSASSVTAGAWNDYKGDVSREIHSSWVRMWSDATDGLHSKKQESFSAPPSSLQPPSRPFPPTQPQQQFSLSAPRPTPQPATSHGPAAVTFAPPLAALSSVPASTPMRVSTQVRTVKPYVTSGLTPLEVLAILGKPTSSVGEKMIYRGSEVEFRNGHVAGWKIDPASSPLRVKLWPGSTPDPDLTSFTLGSSKSDVITLQGTPNLFSENKFSYGNSDVIFRNDRVIGWNEDPNSVHLRVAH